MGMAAARLFQGIGRRMDSFAEDLERVQFNIGQRKASEAAVAQAQREWDFKLKEYADRRADAAETQRIANQASQTATERLELDRMRFEADQAHRAAQLTNSMEETRGEAARWRRQFDADREVDASVINRNNAAAAASAARSEMGDPFGDDILDLYGENIEVPNYGSPRFSDPDEAMRNAGQTVYGARGLPVPERFQDPPPPPPAPVEPQGPNWLSRLVGRFRNDGSRDLYAPSPRRRPEGF